MTGSDNQITQWLKKLEQESWQLELLVSAFTIFLLIQASMAFDEFFIDLQFTYNLSNGILAFLFFFLVLISTALDALTMFLIVHLMLRGFWIGSIGLRSVQSTVDFSALKYSEFFTEKLRKKVISLDSLVIRMDEICSVIFSFSFLVISILLSFGLYLTFLGLFGVMLNSVSEYFSGIFNTIYTIISVTMTLLILISGIIYVIDYFTLGFFKKYKWFSKIYYPFYRFYGLITLSFISRSIYYYLISKFSKRRIRIGYLFVGIGCVSMWFFEYDQYQFYPENTNNKFYMSHNFYDDLRKTDGPAAYVMKASIQSRSITGPYLELFLRYDPKDNPLIQSNCPDFTPMKSDGINPRLKLVTRDMSVFIQDQNYDEEDLEKLLKCMSALYEITINDSIYSEIHYYFFEHPSKDQKGIQAMISTRDFNAGENKLQITKRSVNEDGSASKLDFAEVPFWYHKE